MGYRVLVNEDTHERAAPALHERGHDAVTVADSVGKGTGDPAVLAHAAETDRVLLTCDDDFLRPEHGRTVRVLYLSEEVGPGEIARRVDRVAELAPDPDDVGRVTHLSTEL